MEERGVLLGIDGGGTKTAFLLINENGDIIDTISDYLDWKIEHESDQNALLFKNDFIPDVEAGRKLSVKEAKRVDNIFDEMLKRELKYKTINFTREHFETVDTARDVMRVEEKIG